MPCNGGHLRPYPDSCDCNTDKLIEEIDELTQLLCFLCGTLTARKQFRDMPKSLKKWWAEHQRQDTRRVGKQMDDYMRRHPDVPWAEVAKHFLKKALKVHPVSSFHQEWFKEMALRALNRKQQRNMKKKARDKEKEAALAKLSKKDRKLLGLDKPKKRRKRA